MMELDENDTLWTDEARESFRTAAANLVEAIRQHSVAVLGLPGTDEDEDTETIAEVGEALAAAASAYADAQFELSATVPPLGLDEEDGDEDTDEDTYDVEDDLDDDDLDEDLEDDLDGDEGELDEADQDADGDTDGDTEVEVEETGEPALRLTVLHRADFVVADESAVIQAGKEAYHDAWDPADQAEPTDVVALGEALEQIQQSGGIEALADTPGLVSAGATTWLLEATDLLDERDPDDEQYSPFALEPDAQRRLLHRVDEVHA